MAAKKKAEEAKAPARPKPTPKPKNLFEALQKRFKK